MTAQKQNQPSLTKNQELVLNALVDAKGPLSAYNILDRLRDEGFKAPLQVYRALEKLLKIGIVHRLECLNAFVACNHPECGSHVSTAFAICESCGRVTEFANQDVLDYIRKWAREEHFQLEKSMIELSGRCENCA